MSRPEPEWPRLVEPGPLTFVRIDHQTRLQFGDVEVTIEADFTLTVAAVEHHLDPGERSGLGPLLGIYPDDLIAATAGADCSLSLEFARGASIHVEQDAHYEAWQISGPGTRLVVCPPQGDGTLAVWE